MRQIKKSRYIIAAVLTFAIFSAGLIVGIFMEKQRMTELEHVSREGISKISSLQLQLEYLDTLEDGRYCSVMKEVLEKNIKEYRRALDRIEGFKDKGLFIKDQYQLIKREYIVAELRYWLLAQKADKECDYNRTTLLYFYTSDCDACKNRQGPILTHIKSKYGGELLIFSIDYELDEPMVEILKQRYNITEVPALIINSNQTYRGVVPDNELQRILSETGL